MKTLSIKSICNAFGAVRKFREAQSGVAMIEFALILPIMIGLYFMLNETTNGMRAARKVTMVARVMADLSSRPPDITDALRNDIFNSAKPILSPYEPSLAGYRISSIRFDGAGKGYVDWSEVSGTGFSAHVRCTPAQPSTPPKTPISVPAGLKVANTSVILAEVKFKYKPILGVTITGTIDLNDLLYMRPRSSDFVTRNGLNPPMCTG
ncbi:MAG: TadE/TadG family type IV pilus assembly protein [Beijerinckiaceae bacterium]